MPSIISTVIVIREIALRIWHVIIIPEVRALHLARSMVGGDRPSHPVRVFHLMIVRYGIGIAMLDGFGEISLRIDGDFDTIILR